MWLKGWGGGGVPKRKFCIFIDFASYRGELHLVYYSIVMLDLYIII